jgi:hypothetical protein
MRYRETLIRAEASAGKPEVGLQQAVEARQGPDLSTTVVGHRERQIQHRDAVR